MFGDIFWGIVFFTILLLFQIIFVMEQIIKNSRYVDPMIDVAFKQIFGQEKNMHLTKGLLEHVFNVEIEELAFVNVEHSGQTLEDRNAVFDIQCRSRQIGDFIVEVQVREQKYFNKRALFYSTFPIAAQAPKGSWDYDFKPVFFLGLVNFKMQETEGYIHRYSVREDNTGALLTNALQFVFMEVGPFNKAWKDCKSFEDRFLYYFKNLPTFVEKPDTGSDSYFEELAAAAELSNMTKAEREAYNLRLKIRRDNENCDAFAREKALNEGLAEGREKGLAEGRAETNKNNAVKMLHLGVDISIIQQVTGLSEEEISALK